MFIVMAVVFEMKMAIVNVVGVTLMLNAGVPAVGAVRVGVRRMDLMFGHVLLSYRMNRFKSANA
jgi:hypothetical protein